MRFLKLLVQKGLQCCSESWPHRNQNFMLFSPQHMAEAAFRKRSGVVWEAIDDVAFLTPLVNYSNIQLGCIKKALTEFSSTVPHTVLPLWKGEAVTLGSSCWLPQFVSAEEEEVTGEVKTWKLGGSWKTCSAEEEEKMQESESARFKGTWTRSYSKLFQSTFFWESTDGVLCHTHLCTVYFLLPDRTSGYPHILQSCTGE